MRVPVSIAPSTGDEGCRGAASARVVLMGLAMLLTLAPRPAHTQQSRPSEGRIETLRFSGVAAASEDSLRSAIVSEASRCRLPGFFPPCWFGLMEDRHFLEEQTLRADALRLRVFYYQRGYRQAEVDTRTERGENGVRLEFRITEGRPVRVAGIEIADSTDRLPPGIRGSLPIGSGDPLDLSAYEATRDTLRDRLRNEGYPRAEVLASYFIPADSPHVARITYTAVPGSRARFGPVQVEGTEAVSPTVVRRMLTFQPGDLYRSDDLLRSQRSLYGLQVFRHVEIRPDFEAEPDSIVPTTVQVDEDDIYRVRLGAGLNTIEAVNAEGRWTSRNFLGGARRLEASARIANLLADPLEFLPGFPERERSELDGGVSVDFSQPWFFGPRNTFNAGLLAERRSLPDVFVRTARGGYLSVSRTLGGNTSLTLSYQPELTELDPFQAQGDLFFCINYLACAANDIVVLQDAHWLAPVALSFTRDRTRSLFSPTDGYVAQLDAEYANGLTGSEFAYVRLLAELRSYHELADGWILGARLRPGWARVVRAPKDQTGLGLNPQKRFFAGGPNSARGFEQYDLGPKVLTIDAARYLAGSPDGEQPDAGCSMAQINSGTCDARSLAENSPMLFEDRPVGGAVLAEGSIEVRFPLWWQRLRGAAFVDFGQVWSSEEDVDPRSIVFTPGLGIRIFSPIGPIRLDVGYNPLDVEQLSVITTTVEPDPGDPEGGMRNTSKLVRLEQPVSWNPRSGSFLDRLQIHFSIGQAF